MNKLYDENNIFAKILRSEIPCNKILENEYAFSFFRYKSSSSNSYINCSQKIHI